MALRVQVLSGLSSEEVATLDCDPAWDVSDLKWELERRKNLPEAEQRLLLGTRVLCDKAVQKDPADHILPEFRQERLGDLATAALTLSLMRLDPQWVGLLQDLRNGRRDWKDMGQELQENREVALAAVQRDPSTLPLLSTELRQDSEIVLAAVQQHGRSLQHALGIARRDPKVLEAALKRDGLAIRFATEEQKGDRHLGLMAVRQNGWALELLGEKLKAEREIVKEAITQEGQAFKFADETLKHDRELMLIALRSNAEALRYAAGGARRS